MDGIDKIDVDGRKRPILESEGALVGYHDLLRGSQLPVSHTCDGRGSMSLTKSACRRTNLAIRSKQDADLYTLTSLAEQGIELRSALHDWEVAANVWKPPTPNDQQMTVAWLFYAAISIYLSGIYDYSHIWADSGILIPTLSVSIIDDHVLSILDITSLAIETKPLAGVLFLFPLRVAGARAYKFEQRLRIKGLLLKIAASFRAANAFFSDLEDLWADPDSYHNQG